jgi:hypothetical protein
VTRAIVAEVCRDFDFRDNSTEQLLRPLAEKREAPSFEVGKPSLVM